MSSPSADLRAAGQAMVDGMVAGLRREQERQLWFPMELVFAQIERRERVARVAAAEERAMSRWPLPVGR